MGEMRRIEVEIDAAMLAAADDAVENGHFADRDAVIGHALALWSDTTHDDFASLPDREQDRLRRLIEEGFASGDPVEDSDGFYDDVKARGRTRMVARRPAA